MSASAVGRRRLLVNATANWLGFAAQVVAALAIAPLLLRGLGEDRYGIWSLVESILAYLMLFDLGVAASVVRYVARFQATLDHDRLNRVFNTSLAIFAVAGLAALLVTLSLALVGLRWLNVPASLAGEARGMLLLLGFNLAAALPLGVFPAVLDGLERYPTKTALRTAALLLRSLAFLWIAREGGGLLELAWTITACNLLEHLAMALAAWWYLPSLRLSPRWLDRETFRAIRGYSLQAFLALVAGRISFQTDALVIGLLLSPRHIAFFVVGARLVEYAKNAVRSLTAVLTPTVSSLEARGETAAIRRVLLDATRYVLWLILPIEVGLLLLGKPFLTVWLGHRYAETSYATLAILSVPLALAMTQSAAARMLYGMGQLGWFVCVVIAEAAANLLLSMALARPLGIEGVALGTAIPNVIACGAILIFTCRRVGVGFGEYLRQAFLGPCLAAALLAGVWGMVGMAWEPTSWGELLAVGLTGMGLYAVLAGVVELGPARVAARLSNRALASPHFSPLIRIAPSPLRRVMVRSGSPRVPPASNRR